MGRQRDAAETSAMTSHIWTNIGRSAATAMEHIIMLELKAGPFVVSVHCPESVAYGSAVLSLSGVPVHFVSVAGKSAMVVLPHVPEYSTR